MKHCPDCDSTDLLVYEETSWYLNTNEFFCHSVKSHDLDAKARCNHCNWLGKLEDVKENLL